MNPDFNALSAAISSGESLEVIHGDGKYTARLLDGAGKTIAERQSETVVDALIDLSNAVA